MKNCSWRLSVIFCFILISLSGCQVFRGFQRSTTPAPPVFQSIPAGEELIQRINTHSERVQHFQSNISLEVPGTPRLTGNLIIERPDQMRLKAGIGGMSELGVDIGSNSELFWIWNKASLPGQPPPAIFYAYQRDYRLLQQMAGLPIDPQWIIDATGLITFEPTDIHQGPFVEPDGRLKINTIRTTDAGSITRVAYIDPRSALVQQQAFYDPQNRLIAYTNAKQFDYLKEHQVSLPRRVDLIVSNPDGQMIKIAINASQTRINSFFGNPDQTWSMPRPDGVRLFNLAEGN